MVKIRRVIGIVWLGITILLAISWIAHGFPGPLILNLVCYFVLFAIGLKLVRPKRLVV